MMAEVDPAAPPLCSLDLDSLSQSERIDALAACERQLAQLAAFQQRVIASLARHAVRPVDEIDEAGKQWVSEDVAAVLKLSSGAARARMANAETLTGRLRDTLALLERGEISLRHALTLVDATTVLDDATTAKVQARVLGRAPTQSVVNFRASVERAVLACDPRRQEEAHQDARTQRRVCFRAAAHGMSDQFAHLPAEDARALALALQAVADADAASRRAAGLIDERTADQRRADALTAMAQHVLDGCATVASDRPGNEHGRRPAVQVTVSISTLLGQDEQPAELDGYGPITAGQGRRIAFDPSSTWYRLITDPVGRLLDCEQDKYRPPQALVDHIAARDQRCRFPHCRRKASRCEIDHVTPFGTTRGGTCVANLVALCPRHHHVKHDSRWRLLGNPAGVLTWVSPTGHRYVSEPEPLPVDAAPAVDDGVGQPAWTPDIDRVGAEAVDAADVAEADAWLDEVLFTECFGAAPQDGPEPDWLAALLITRRSGDGQP